MVITNDECRAENSDVFPKSKVDNCDSIGGTAEPEGHLSTQSMLPGMDQTIQEQNKCHDLNVSSSTSHNLDSSQNMGEKKSGDDIKTDQKHEETEDWENRLEPPDGGYGWFIVLGSFLGHVLIGGLERGEGLFFLMFESRFQQSAALTAWPGAVADMLRLAMGPIASAICQRWSARACCLIGGLALGFSHILTAFSPNFSVVFISHGFMEGVGRGLVYGPFLIQVNMYFQRRRGSALGLAGSGIGVGALTLVPLVQFLFDTYGFTGGFFVLGAVCFNALLMAMLFRPLFLHYRFIGKKRSVINTPSISDTALSNMAHPADAANDRLIRRSITSIDQEVNKKQETSQGLLQTAQITDSPLHNCKSKNFPSNSSNPSKPPPTNKSGFWKSSFDIIFPRNHKHRTSEDTKGRRGKYFHFELLRDPAFFSFCLSLGMFTSVFQSTFTFMPALVKSRGLTSSEAVIILSCSGAVDTTGRILAGFLLDKPLFRARRPIVYSCFQFLLAGLCALMPILGANFFWLCVISSLFGMMTGVLASQKSAMCVDLLGAEYMSNGLGILLLFQAVGVGLGPLLSGACRDAFGRFHEAFYLGAGLMAVAACFMVYSTIVHSLNRRRQKENKNVTC